MSRENVEIVRRVLGSDVIDATEPGVVEGIVERLPAEIEFEEDPRFPEAGVYRGRSELLGYYRQFTSEFERFVFEVEEIVSTGPADVLVLFRLSGLGSGSSATFEFRPAWLFTVRDGRVTRIKAYLDRDEALEATGRRG